MSHPKYTEVVLVVGDPATSASGPNEIVRRLAGWLVERGYPVTIVGTCRGSNPPVRELRRLYGEARIVLHRRYLRDTWHFAPGVLAMAIQRLFSRKACVIDVHGVWLFNGFVLSLVALTKGWRCFVTLHGNLRPVSLKKNRIAKRLALNWGVKWWLRHASGLIVLNRQEESDAKEIVSEASFLVVGNGIRPHPLALTSSRGNELLFLGRIDPIKNLESLIVGFSNVCREFPEWILSIVGPCKTAVYLQELKRLCVSLDLDNRVHFCDAAYGAEKEARLLSASLFALTSWSEGQPFAVLEALAHGLPVLLSDQCNIEVPPTCGKVVACSPDTVALGLRLLLRTEPTELMRMRTEALNFVREAFSEDSAFEQRRRIYFSLGRASEVL